MTQEEKNVIWKYIDMAQRLEDEFWDMHKTDETIKWMAVKHMLKEVAKELKITE